MRRPARSLIALLGIGALVSWAALIPAAALAADAVDVPLTVAGDTPTTVYGSITAEGPQIPVSTATTVFEVHFGSVSDTSCRLLSAEGRELYFEEWYGQGEDDDGVRRFSIPAGLITDAVRYTVACQDGNFTARNLEWNVIGTGSRTGSVERLDPDPALVVRAEINHAVYVENDAIPPVPPGTVLRLIGPVGTWETGADLAVTVGGASASASVSDDGSTLSFPVPKLPAGDAVIDAATTTTTVAGVPVRVQRTTFRGSVEVVDSASTTTGTVLSLSSGRVAFTKARATVEVTASDRSAPVGEVVVYGDGHVISRARMVATDAGTIVVTLPRLTRGSHAIVAEFRPAGAATPSTSAPVRLRQLR